MRKRVAQRIYNQYTYIRKGDILSHEGLLEYPDNIECVRVSHCESHSDAASPSGCRVDATALTIFVYAFEERSTDTRHAYWKETRLPCADLDFWHEIHIQDHVPEKLFIQMFSAVTRGTWIPFALLHGPPGTGKTSLCRALAQQLAISATETFTSTFLLETHTHELFSSLFGQSARLIAEFCNRVKEVARNDECLVCILIDELESVGMSRRRTTGGNESVESLRVTNELLKQLDLLRQYRNVVIFCTTNFLEAVDHALVDRLELLQRVDLPNQEMAYNILRSNIVFASEDDSSRLGEHRGLSTATHAKMLSSIPSYAAAYVDTYAKKKTVASKLLEAATTAAGSISGRRLARISLGAMRTSVEKKSVDVDRITTGIALAIQEELSMYVKLPESARV